MSCVDEMIGAEDLVGEDFERKVASERKQRLQSRKNSMFQHNSNNKMEAEEESDKNSTSKLIGNAFQIATDTNGYNSGRSYYLQTASANQKQEIIAHLKTLATSARKKAEVKSLFRKTQDRVRAWYISRPFQSGAALLIVAVQSSLFIRILYSHRQIFFILEPNLHQRDSSTELSIKSTIGSRACYAA